MSADNYQLLFFRNYPERLDKRPSLLSSLQSFETALVLLSTKRYPHALTAFAQAVESALRCLFRVKPDEEYGFFKLLVDSLKEKPALRKSFASPNFRPGPRADYAYLLKDTPLNEFRVARNDFMHRGFSPDDDERSARLLLSVGLPFLEAVYEELQFDLYDALRADLDLSTQLRTAVAVFKSLKANQNNLMKSGFQRDRQSIACLCVSSKQIDWIRSPRNEWESEVLERADSDGVKFEVIENLRSRVERQLGTPWTFDCPVCDENQTLVCDLELDNSDLPPVTIKKAICLACHLRLPTGFFLLNNAVCQEQIDSQRERILREHGCCV